METTETIKTKTKSSDKQSAKSNNVKNKKDVKSSQQAGEFLHLMAIVDLSAMLYPGGNLFSPLFYQKTNF